MIIGSRWTAQIMRELIDHGARRFQDLQDALVGIPPNTLSSRLKMLEEGGIVKREFYETHPPRAEYVLTPKGKKMNAVINAMRDWGNEEETSVESLVLLGGGAVLGVIFGWVAFFMVLSARRRIRDLEIEVARLKGDAPEQTSQTASSFQQASAPATQSQAAPDTGTAEAVVETSAGEDIPWRENSLSEQKSPKDAVGFDFSLGGNWLIWLGGVALILGGAFLVKVAVDAGFFGPVMRVLLGIAAGATMIAAAQWLKMGGAPKGSLAPNVLAGAGGATIYGAIFAAYGLYNLIPSTAAFILLALVSVGVVGLAVIHRTPAMAALAIIGAHASPVITASGEPSAVAFYLYIYAITAGGLFVARIMRWRMISYLALAGGLLWPFMFVLENSGAYASVLFVYLPAFLLLSAFVAWDEASEALDIARLLQAGLKALPVSVAAFHLAAAATFIISIMLTVKFGLAAPATVMWGAFAVMTLAGARYREGLSLALVMAMLATAVIFAFAEAASSTSPVVSGAMFSVLYALGGYGVMRLLHEKAPAALAAAFGPSLIMSALFFSQADMQQATLWGFVALAVAVWNILVLAEIKHRLGGFDVTPGASAAFALAASLATTLAVAMAADGLAMSFGFAIQAPVIAWLWRRFNLPALKYAASALAALGALRLLFLPEVLLTDVGSWPVFNWLAPAYLLPAAGFWLAARWFHEGGLAGRSPVVQGMEGAAIALFAAFISLELRHLFNEGRLDADFDSFLEVTLQTISWALLATFLRWRFGGDLTRIRTIVVRGLLWVSAFLSFAAALAAFNPWWGEDAQMIGGAFLFNMLIIFYLAPAGAYALAAIVAHHAGERIQARLAALFAALMSFTWMILTIRQGFHAPDLSVGAVGNGESWSYSIAMIVYATAVLVAAVIRRSAVFRYAGLAALMLAVGKVFIVDTAAMDGVWRATSFLGLGAALVGIAVFYQRVLAAMVGTRSHVRVSETLQRAISPWRTPSLRLKLLKIYILLTDKERAAKEKPLMSKSSILVAGAGGRMGKAVVSEVLKTPGANLAGGFERPGGPHIGKDIGVLAGLDAIGLAVEDAAEKGLKRAAVMIDFTTPDASVGHAKAAAEKGVAHVIGATGFSLNHEAEIAEIAKQIPIVKSGNMSVGVNILTALVEEAARALENSYDIEIIEAHHGAKLDAPSGTALMLGKAAARGRAVDFAEKAVGMAGDRTGKRQPGDIGFAVVRGGGIVGDHDVVFAGADEVIRLSHHAIDRGLFAKGAVVAARWAVGKPPGLYSMRDVLGLG
ncbi:4-hydroxy-tetrahydrodipicolinate reductase (HTPA reductase) [Durusdinium trenchii]|uniref:4-hydroxy-tetrahydrodipicolinate reductase (HTPA reductase) n=1 Tax=Durusdinium trenchii TaxID=1381693 RepID=A0ABP0LMR2_9DINO